MSNAELIKRLRAEGESALRKHLSMGMADLCCKAADALVDLEAKLANAERQAEDAESRNDFLISQLEELIEKERKDKE